MSTASPSRWKCPREAEIVIEGYVDLTDYRDEGPFGDHTGYYTPVERFPVFHVTAITHRRDANLPGHGGGHPTHGRCLDGQGHRAAVPAR